MGEKALEEQNHVANQEFFQLINTAIIKSRQESVDTQFEKRLGEIGQSQAIASLELAIGDLAEKESLSRDQAAAKMMSTIRSLEKLWSDYIALEGLEKLKKLVQG